MTAVPGIVRAKVVITEHGPTLAVLLAVIGLVCLAGTGWMLLNPPTTTVTDQSNEQQFESSLRTSTVVTSDSEMYDAGTRIENQPVYFTETMPNLTLTAVADVPDDRPVTVRHQLVLSMRATRDGEVFWERTRILIDEQTTTTNGSVVQSTVINVPAFSSGIAPVQDEIGSAGSLSVAVGLTTTYETDTYSGTLQRQPTLGLSGRTYTLDPVSASKRESTSETRTVVVPSQNRRSYTLPAGVGALALLSAAVILILYRRRDRWGSVEDHVYQNRYAEWISVGTLGTDVAERSVHMDSVEDVVDVAIDMDKRVIYDPSRDVHAVIDGTMLYYHGPENPLAAVTPGE